MPRPIYSEIHLHITWHTKDNAAVISGPIETQLHQFLRNRALQSPGVLLHAIGGTDDHVHLAVSAPPTLLVSDWVGELKGASAHYINHRVANRKLLAWQTGYGGRQFWHEGGAVGGAVYREPTPASRGGDNDRPPRADHIRCGEAR